MKYKVYKLKFNTAVHIGKGRLDDAESTFMADTIFSALCCEAAADGEESVRRLADMVRTDRLVISDAMPYHNDTLYIVKPYLSPENTDESNSAAKKQAKKLKYIQAGKIDEYLRGNLDISAANSELDDMGKKEIRTMASVSDIEDTKPYSVGAYRFNEGWGLYTVIGYETEEVLTFIDRLIRSLGYSGIGGKRSAGLGRFECECVSVPEALEKGLSGEACENYILLSSAMATEDRLPEALDGAKYMLEKRSGFVYSDTYADTDCKKNDIFLFKAGSVFKTTFTGILADVSVAGNHPVYRYAKPVFVGVKQ